MDNAMIMKRPAVTRGARTGDVFVGRTYKRPGAVAERGWTGEESTMPPQHLLDAIADRQMSGGYKITKKNTCKKCHMVKFANGTCMC
jgi:hypothetical protein